MDSFVRSSYNECAQLCQNEGFGHSFCTTIAAACPQNLQEPFCKAFCDIDTNEDSELCKAKPVTDPVVVPGDLTKACVGKYVDEGVNKCEEYWLKSCENSKCKALTSIQRLFFPKVWCSAFILIEENKHSKAPLLRYQKIESWFGAHRH